MVSYDRIGINLLAQEITFYPTIKASFSRLFNMELNLVILMNDYTRFWVKYKVHFDRNL